MSEPHVGEPQGAQAAEGENAEATDRSFTVTDKRRIDPETGEVRNPRGSSPAGPEEAAEVVEADVFAAEAAVAELTADLQRIHAEYANYRKRVERDREVAREIGVAAVLTELLPVLDDIGRAREHGELEGAFKSVGEALELAAARVGLVTYGAPDEQFDPMRHEALTHAPDESGEGPTETVVAAVYQPGYSLGERVLRPARVAVADRPAQ